MGKKTSGLLKAIVAGILIYWLIVTKKITWEPFAQLWATPWLTFFVFGILLFGIFVNNYRWLLLLKGQKIQSDLKQTLSLTFIGLFFNLAMPGSVGGDLIRGYYIVQERPEAKLGAATSVLMDRVVGLYAMALIALGTVILFPQKILYSAHLRPLAFSIFFLTIGFTLFFIVGFSDWVRRHPWTETFLHQWPLLTKMYDTIHAFRNGKTQFVIGIFLSIVVQTTNIFCFYIVAGSLGFSGVTLASLFFVCPLGLIASAIPISPGGLGVGQTAFFALFSWYGGMEPQVGPTLITIYQVLQAALSLVGATLYFLRKGERLGVNVRV